MNPKSKAAANASELEFVISRVFEAPRERLFKAWTDPVQLARWWGPHDFTNPVCEIDLRTGGSFRIVMRSPEGGEYPYRGIFREIVAPERLVYTDDCTEMPDEWHDLIDPERDRSAPRPALASETTVTFESLGRSGSQTRLTVRTRFASAAIRDAMLKMQMADGWGQSLERLADCLAEF